MIILLLTTIKRLVISYSRSRVRSMMKRGFRCHWHIKASHFIIVYSSGRLLTNAVRILIVIIALVVIVRLDLLTQGCRIDEIIIKTSLAANLSESFGIILDLHSFLPYQDWLDLRVCRLITSMMLSRIEINNREDDFYGRDNPVLLIR